MAIPQKNTNRKPNNEGFDWKRRSKEAERMNFVVLLEYKRRRGLLIPSPEVRRESRHSRVPAGWLCRPRMLNPLGVSRQRWLYLKKYQSEAQQRGFRLEKEKQGSGADGVLLQKEHRSKANFETIPSYV